MLDRFEEKFIPEPNSGCWLWTGGGNGKGYGLLSFKVCRKRKLGLDTIRYNKLAHRVSWERKHGQIPEGMMVLHKCDVRCCVNPDHLFLGSARDNTQDMIAKGRRSSMCCNPYRDNLGRYTCAS